MYGPKRPNPLSCSSMSRTVSCLRCALTNFVVKCVPTTCTMYRTIKAFSCLVLEEVLFVNWTECVLVPSPKHDKRPKNMLVHPNFCARSTKIKVIKIWSPQSKNNKKTKNHNCNHSIVIGEDVGSTNPKTVQLLLDSVPSFVQKGSVIHVKNTLALPGNNNNKYRANHVFVRPQGWRPPATQKQNKKNENGRAVRPANAQWVGVWRPPVCAVRCSMWPPMCCVCAAKPFRSWCTTTTAASWYPRPVHSDSVQKLLQPLSVCGVERYNAPFNCACLNTSSKTSSCSNPKRATRHSGTTPIRYCTPERTTPSRKRRRSMVWCRWSRASSTN